MGSFGAVGISWPTSPAVLQFPRRTSQTPGKECALIGEREQSIPGQSVVVNICRRVLQKTGLLGGMKQLHQALERTLALFTACLRNADCEVRRAAAALQRLRDKAVSDSYNKH